MNDCELTLLSLFLFVCRAVVQAVGYGKDAASGKDYCELSTSSQFARVLACALSERFAERYSDLCLSRSLSVRRWFPPDSQPACVFPTAQGSSVTRGAALGELVLAHLLA